jgi:CheY-like chemotaxis protein
MCPENANVFVVEDDKFWQEAIKENLSIGGHRIVLSATSLKDALEATNNLSKFGVQVATVDGNLGGYSAGHDGQKVIAAIREKAPEVKIIGFSSDPLPGTDVDLTKWHPGDLSQTVTDI